MLGLPLRSSNPDLADKKYIAAMFASGEQGAWYDPSDLSTMYQDAAGTIPVTAVGQPVGLILDKSKNGVGTNGAKRVNLLKNTESFSSSSWVKASTAVIENTTVAPDGTNTADSLIEAGLAITDLHRIYVSYTYAAAEYIVSCYFKKLSANRYAQIRVRTQMYSGTILAAANFNLDTGTGSVNGVNAAAEIQNVGNGWYKCSVRFTALAGAFETGFLPTLVDGTASYIGDGTSGVYIWGADLRLASEASTLPTYQRIDADWPSTFPGNHATQSTTASRPTLQIDTSGNYYLSFDGIDDSLVTPSINFTATDKMTVLTADTGFWNNNLHVIAGLSSSAFGNNGTFWVTSYDSNFNAYSMVYLRGTLRGATQCGPDQRTLGQRTLVRAVRFDISGATLSDEIHQRLNGIEQTVRAILDASAGTGNFGNWPLYIGRIGSGSPFKGGLYGLIVRGAATDDNHLTHAEKYLAYKSGISL